MDIVSRKDAKVAGKLRYYTGKPCKHGHVAERTTSNGCCLACNAEHKQRTKAHRAEVWATYRERNHEQLKGKWKAHRDANKDSRREYHKEWCKTNPSKYTEYNAKRRAAKLQRTPSWLTELDEFLLSETYQHSQDLTKATGIQHHVDHIIPLQGELVSGLHIPSNLQVITEHENCSKSNTFTLE